MWLEWCGRTIYCDQLTCRVTTGTCRFLGSSHERNTLFERNRLIDCCSSQAFGVDPSTPLDSGFHSDIIDAIHLHALTYKRRVQENGKEEVEPKRCSESTSKTCNSMTSDASQSSSTQGAEYDVYQFDTSNPLCK